MFFCAHSTFQCLHRRQESSVRPIGAVCVALPPRELSVPQPPIAWSSETFQALLWRRWWISAILMVLSIKARRQVGLTRRTLAAKAEFVPGKAILLIKTIFCSAGRTLNWRAKAPDCLCNVAWIMM